MKAKQVQRIKQLTSLGIEGAYLVPKLMKELREIIPTSANTLMFTNSSFQVRNIYDDGPNVLKYGPLYAQEFLGKLDRDAHPYWGDWLRTHSGITTTEKFVFGKFYRSALYNEVLKPMYQHHSLIAAIKTKNNPVGVLLLTRSDHDSKFTAKEEKCFNELLPFIINGLSYKDEDKPQIADSGEAGIIIFNQEAKLLHLSEQARVLLFRATHPGELAVKPDGFKVPQGVKQLVKNLVALFKSKGLDVSPPVWRQQSAWGEFDFRAQWLGSYEQNSDSLIAVTIQYREPIKLKIWRICEEFKLTNKQAEVTMLVVEGYTYEAIAERMAISKYTVIDYVKILFEKFDVKNRNQLVSKIAWLK